MTANGRIDDPQARSGSTSCASGARRPRERRIPRLLARKLIFRGAWLDQRVKENRLEVDWDGDTAEFGYREPDGGRALLELAPGPSWHGLQFRRFWERREGPAVAGPHDARTYAATSGAGNSRKSAWPFALPLPLSVPSMAELVIANASVACAAASDIWSSAVFERLTNVSQAWW